MAVITSLSASMFRLVTRSIIESKITLRSELVCRLLSNSSEQGGDDGDPKKKPPRTLSDAPRDFSNLDRPAMRGDQRFNQWGNQRDGQRGNQRTELGDRRESQFENRRESQFSGGGNNQFGYRRDKQFSDRRNDRFGDRKEDRFGARRDLRFDDRRNDRFNERRSDRFSERRDDRFSDRRDDQMHNQRGFPPLDTRSSDQPSYYSGNPLNVFKNKPANSDYHQLDNWKRFRDSELDLSFRLPPKNAFEEMIQLTKEGKFWSFPIDNETGLEEEAKIPFYEHTMLDHLLEKLPDSRPVREFMDIVLTGVTNNPHITVERKHAIIEWYVNFFNEKETVLKETGAL